MSRTRLASSNAGMAHLEGGRVVELRGLLLDRLDDLGPVVARVAAPEPGGAVQHLAPVRRLVMHPVGADEHARRFLELPVRGERHPEGAQVVRNRVGSVKGHIGTPHIGPGFAPPGAAFSF
jgi:hypothetical protein